MQELYLTLEIPEDPKSQVPDTTEQRGCEEIDFSISDDNVTETLCDTTVVVS